MEEKRSYAVPVTIGLLLLLPVIYVGSYFALVQRTAAYGGSFSNSDYGSADNGTAYRLRGEWVHRFYAPMHWVDRKVRPNYWD